jgi:hypothetical protein
MVVHVLRDAFVLRQCYNLRFPCEDKEVGEGGPKADCQISARQFYGAQPRRTLNCRYPYKALTLHQISQPILLDRITSGQQDHVKPSQRPLKANVNPSQAKAVVKGSKVVEGRRLLPARGRKCLPS